MKIFVLGIRNVKIRNENQEHAKLAELNLKKILGSLYKMWTASNPSLPSPSKSAADDRNRRAVIQANHINELKSMEVNRNV